MGRRRQVETLIAASLATVTAVIGISERGDAGERLGPKFLTLDKVGRFEQPVHLAQPPGVDSPLFVVERPGTVRVIADGEVQRRAFLDLRREVKDTGKGGEQGLMSIAFPPDYADSRRFYVAYTDDRNGLRVVEFRTKPNEPLRARRKSERLVLRIPQPTTKHHGGLLLFGPDKLLYLGTGDGGPSTDPNNVAQNRRLLLGKILRIDPEQGEAPAAQKPEHAPKMGGGNKAGSKAGGEGGGGKGRSKKQGKPRKPPAYTVPKDNPLVGRPGRDEIYAYGLRNPWRFSFDRGPAGDLIAIGDVGDQDFEEINILPVNKAKGANFGWSAFEGRDRLKKGVARQNTVTPVYAYPHGSSRCSVIGGYVVRDPRLARISGREVVGRYLFADFCSRRLFAFRPRPGRAGRERSFRFQIPGVTSFGEDRAGRIYVLTYDGPVYRLGTSRKKVSG
jgi:glucose/arabinose dehydrogenase